MTKINIILTQNPSIIKFEFPDFISRGEGVEFKNIDEAKNSPLAQQLFYLPFVKSVYIASNFIAVERYDIVTWDDVAEDVAEQIQNFVDDGGVIISNSNTAKNPKGVEVYGEITPNPGTLKFVTSIMLTQTSAEFKNIDQTAASPLARELFNFPYVKEIFIDENYVSVTKYDLYEWSDISHEIRAFIKQYIQNGGEVVKAELLQPKAESPKTNSATTQPLDATSQQIISILDEYVKPAVASDGGNILFESYNDSDKTVRVVLQGACNGCPSSTFTLKSGIENMLRDMLNDEKIKVEAVNP
ncbi:MAG: NifU family protein [Flavobacterium sp.]|nr:MAG: NifU family protein [Flavobacterium sp.]